MAYLSYHTLSQDSQFRNMLKVSMAKQALAVQGETRGSKQPIEWQKRAALAANVLSVHVAPSGTSYVAGTDVWLETFALACAQNPTIGGAAVPYADTTQHDNDLDFQVAAVWNDVAGVTGQDLGLYA